MANSHRSHRLERLFSKRKPPNYPRPAEPQPTLEPVFPQPSFIRPKSSRMMARDEVSVRAPSPSKLSLADSRSSRPSYSEVDLFDNTHLERASQGAGSLLERNEVTTPELEVLRHSSQLYQTNGEFSASSSHVIPVVEHRMSPSQVAGSDATMPQFQRLETPPASESEDSYSLDSKSTSAQPGVLTDTGLPTPGPSPDMSPVSDSSLDGHHGAICELNTDNITETVLQGMTVEPFAAAPTQKSRLRTAVGDGSTSQGAVLKEPTLGDFLNLSDDDIAEEQPENKGGLESQNLPPTPSSLDPRERAVSLLTLPAPFSSGPATAAAIEAARIATRHNFDLIYVVNLWPEKAYGRDAQSTPRMWPTRALKNKDGMRGRFLAAYGLSTAKSPFRISTTVHKRILRTDGWIEYLNDKAEPDDFACGYACAFYQGQYSGSHTPDSPARSTAGFKSTRKSINRGIIFAAYRRPRRSGNNAEIQCGQQQLSSIYRDAEALIEMLIDAHIATRLRNSGQSTYSDETGPLPVNSPMKFSW